jgi:hypothetical protein
MRFVGFMSDDWLLGYQTTGIPDRLSGEVLPSHVDSLPQRIRHDHPGTSRLPALKFL